MNTDFIDSQDLKEGQSLLQIGLRAIFFSGRTYQVEVLKGEKATETFWVFLGLDEERKPSDYFCTCDDFEERGCCKHFAAAYLAIFDENGVALHERYPNSLWYHLFFIIARRHGFSPKVTKNKSGFTLKSSSDKGLFSIKAKDDEGKAKLDEFVFNRVEETEENSIKFTNLSTDEYTKYKEGRPSIDLQFELSMWSDFAKWLLFLTSQGKGYRLSFDGDGTKLPTELKVEFDSIEFSLYLAKANWQELLPVLKQIDSPMPVYDFGTFNISKMSYDPVEKYIELEKEEFEFPAKSKVVDLGGWDFRPHYGFFPHEDDPLFDEDVIEANDLEELFRRHLPLLQSKLEGCEVSLDPIEPQYSLFVEPNGNLHIMLYAFKEGDLSHEDSYFFSPWAYVPEHGFVRFKETMFDTQEKIISRDKISEFITHYRAWLSSFEGFETHLSSMESQLTYQVRADRSLIFNSDDSFEGNGVVDLGEWLYIEGQGFFSKNKSGAHSFLKAGMRLEAHDVSGFIRSHEPELELVQGFFAETCPVVKMELKVELNELGVIEVSPMIHYATGYEDLGVVVFNEYAYTPGEGFYRMPEASLLPAGYEQPKEIPTFLEQHFLSNELEDLKPYLFHLDTRLREADEMRLYIEHVECDEKKGEWKFKMKVRSEHGFAPISELFYAVTTSKPFLTSDAGHIMIKEPRFDWMKPLSEGRLIDGGVKLNTMQWIRACIYEEVEFGPECDSHLVNVLQQFKMPQLECLQTPNLTGFMTKLRPYQELGVKWIWNLYLNHLSGILADDMGLGKTHQSMGLIAAVRNHCGVGEAKFFVVCPTSVLYHWENLLARFLPDVSVYMYYGPNRKLSGYENADLFLTSYGTLRTDIEKLKGLKFEAAIFDEMQNAKNKQSQIHKALKALDSKMKLGLSGTPIENELFELKALFDILLPQFFPTDKVFKQMFVTPLDSDQMGMRAQLLRGLISPFILRRRKTEVLQDLPEKIEEIAYVELSDEQKRLYNQIFKTGFHELEEVQKSNESQLYVHVFALLNKLKQVCDHPCLVSKDSTNYLAHESGKFELLKELISEARESGQKVVIFTQYIDMLRIILHYLDSLEIGHACIHGATKDRKEQVERFREDPECEVFVASLQAGGVGIDLISASVVIHYDRWWNPAKENQATDRVHRFGQTRGVQVFKMVAKGTIEEHINEMIEKKKGLMQHAVGYDDENQFKKIDPKELMTIMRQVHIG